MKASFIAFGFIAAVAAQYSVETTSCSESESSAMPTSTAAPYPTGSASATPYPIGTGYPTSAPSPVSSGVSMTYPASSPIYPMSSKSTTTIYECDTSSEVPTYPASSEAVYPTTSAAAVPTSTYAPSPIVSTATISTCVPTVITTVYTITPTVAPTYPASGYPSGTAASSGVVYPTTSVTPFTGGAAAKQAGGLLMVAGIAAALL